MNIINKKINEIKPYGKNPRKNNEAVPYVANSIKEFGFKVPIVIDKNGVIVCGHTRYKAAKSLNMKEVPCVIADDLSDEQIKAYRLADNKVSEKAEWDIDLLDNELDDILNLDMTDFGFDFNIDDEDDNQNNDENNEENDIFDDIEGGNKYGVPYQGNKSRIADIIISILPSGKRLVDLFGGGGAITHCAMLSGKWEKYLYNDINPLITGLFWDAAHGKYHDEHRVITREDFKNLKDTDAYVKYIWSFGNNGTGYLWGKDIEELKCTACHIILDEDKTDRRLAYRNYTKLLQEYLKNNEKYRENNEKYRGELESLESLERLQSLESLERLQSLESLEITNKDYREYKYQDGDVIYCDVPYEQVSQNKKSCNDYGVQFNSLEFYEWVKQQKAQVFFSSYEISDDSFYKVKLKTINQIFGSKSNSKKQNEYLYSNQPIIYKDEEVS